MQDIGLKALYELCINNTATAEQRRTFARLMTMPEHEAEARELVMHALTMLPADHTADAEITESIIESILSAAKETGLHSAPEPAAKIYFFRRPWFRYAAAVVFIIGVAAFFWKNNGKSHQPPVAQVQQVQQPDVAPGGNKAILTLADGRTIELDSATNGLLAHQGNTKIVKLQNGQIAYDLKGAAAEAMINTMTTPRGGQYRLALPDGTQVWLNAASSITYPTAFTGKERKVKVTGEVYFEVASNPNIPFTVQVNESAAIEVLGTRFNIDSYGDAGMIKTTLLEGRIRTSVSAPHQEKDVAVLAPGQQAQIGPSQKIKVVNNVDLNMVMAWKNGLFNFDNASLKEVMQQLARWYDIEVVYEKGVPEMNFGGEVSRNVSLSGLLNGLEKAGVHFRIEAGRRLIVMP